MYFHSNRQEFEAETENYHKEKIVHYDVETCTHSDPMFDDTTSTCTGCGVVFGKTFAPLSANSGILGGAHHHAFASAVRKPRDKKPSSPKVVKPPPKGGGRSSSPRRNKRQQPPSPQQQQPAVPVIAKPPPTTPTPAAAAVSSPKRKRRLVTSKEPIYPPFDFQSSSTITTKSARALVDISTKVVTTCLAPNHDLANIILTGGFILKSSVPCPIAATKTKKELIDLNIRIVSSFQTIVESNKEFFSSHRRRTHVEVFIVALAAHLLVVHNNDEEGIGIEECLDLKRIKERVRPSHSGSPPRSLILALCSLTGTGITSIPRLVEEASEIASLSRK